MDGSDFCTNSCFLPISYRLRSKRIGKGAVTTSVKVVTSSALSPSEHQQLAAVARATQDKMLAKAVNIPEIESLTMQRMYNVPPG